MFDYNQKKKCYSIVKLFFAAEEDFFETTYNTDVINAFYCKYSSSNIRGVFSSKTYSAVNDLTLSKEELRAAMTKTVRYEITRAEKESIDIQVYMATDISNDTELLSLLNAEYIRFCDEKKYDNIKDFFNISELRDIAAINHACVTMASFAGGKIYHVYYFDSKHAMLKYSFSVSTSASVDKNLNGRANKLLHLKDMFYFKTLGVAEYDWGGLFDPANPNGIDKFKLSFGSQPCAVYNIFRGNTLKGKFLVFALKFKQEVRGKKHA